jgi:selenoprotein W-related protein
VSAATELLSNYQHVISELDLVTGDKGIFDVQVDGELIYSKKATGRHAEPGEVLELFERFLPSGTPRYGD